MNSETNMTKKQKKSIVSTIKIIFEDIQGKSDEEIIINFFLRRKISWINKENNWDIEKVEFFWETLRSVLEEEFMTHKKDGVKEYNFHRFHFPRFQKIIYKDRKDVKDISGTKKFCAGRAKDFWCPGELLRFNKPVSFSDAVFEAKASFTDIVFEGTANFTKCEFQKEAVFVNTKFVGKADFKSAHFEESVDFSNTAFQTMAVNTSTADSSGAIFQKEASFKKTRFDKEANFVGTRFRKEGLFEGARFSSDHETIFSAYGDEDKEPPKLYFKSARFSSLVEFHTMNMTQTRFTRSTHLEDVHFFDCIFRHEIAKRYQIYERGDQTPGELQKTYAQLKRNFDEKRLYQEAGEFYISEMEMRKKTLREAARDGLDAFFGNKWYTKPLKKVFFWTSPSWLKLVPDRIFLFFYGWVSQYNERVGRPLLIWFAIIAFFAFLFSFLLNIPFYNGLLLSFQTATFQDTYSPADALGKDKSCNTEAVFNTTAFISIEHALSVTLLTFLVISITNKMKR